MVMNTQQIRMTKNTDDDEPKRQWTRTTTKAKVYKFIEQGQRDEIKPKLGMTICESFESEVNAELNKARDNTGRHATKSLKNDSKLAPKARSLTSHKCLLVWNNRVSKANKFPLASDIAPFPIFQRMITALRLTVLSQHGDNNISVKNTG
jgi:hypothetical protein